MALYSGACNFNVSAGAIFYISGGKFYKGFYEMSSHWLYAFGTSLLGWNYSPCSECVDDKYSRGFSKFKKVL